MDYNDFSRRLDRVPNPTDAIDQLFDGAKALSSQIFYPALLNFCRFHAEGKPFLFDDYRPTLIVEQFGDFLETAARVTKDDVAHEYESVVLRLHMLAYSQFWEHDAIKTILDSLVTASSGESIEPGKFSESRKEKTAIFYEKLIKKAKQNRLSLGPVIEVIYNHQLRNAFAHSDYYLENDIITFENYNQKNRTSLPSLKTEHWNKLWGLCLLFILRLFKRRRDAIKLLRDQVPYPVKIAGNRYNIDRDNRGFFVLRQSKIILLDD